MPPVPTSSPPHRSRLAKLFVVGAVVFAAAAALQALVPHPALRTLAHLAFACFLLLGLAWLFRVLWVRFFWSVGRRLAVSYLLLGLLPIGLMALLAAVSAYMLGGFLLGHHYRDGVDSTLGDLETAAHQRLALDPRSDSPGSAAAGAELRFADYRRGRRVGGALEAPETWPEWLQAAQRQRHSEAGDELRQPFVALADGRISLAAVAASGERATLVWIEGGLEPALRARTRTWLQLFRSDDPRERQTTRIQLGTRQLVFRGLWVARKPEELAAFYQVSPPPQEPPGLWDRPSILWVEPARSLRALADGVETPETVTASIAASPRGLVQKLLSSSEQADSTAWLALAGIAVVLLEIYAAAAALAVFMIVGLSRAVNRLSRATEAVGRGDFSVRIPVRRRDQLGAVQSSFNAMTEHLQELVQTAVQKEALDKELELARQVQQSLLPEAIERREGVEIATHFEPSAAIGGDYYDVLARPDRGFAVVVADVAGHGLAAGLRMAVIQSALALLVEDGAPPERIFARLHRLLRSRPGERSFVTATLAMFDPATGALEITNAGHPPTYLVRAGGEVEELAVPGTPLGSLPGPPGRLAAVLRDGDAAVWLSDGLIEARSPTGELFGYDRVRRCLAGPPLHAYGVRDRLIAAVRAHTGSAPAEDDRTVVALLYQPPAASPRKP